MSELSTRDQQVAMLVEQAELLPMGEGGLPLPLIAPDVTYAVFFRCNDSDNPEVTEPDPEERLRVERSIIKHTIDPDRESMWLYGPDGKVYRAIPLTSGRPKED